MINVQYTEQEMQALTQLIDLATKAGGLSVAGAATVLHQKHVNALKAHTVREPMHVVDEPVTEAN